MRAILGQKWNGGQNYPISNSSKAKLFIFPCLVSYILVPLFWLCIQKDMKIGTLSHRLLFILWTWDFANLSSILCKFVGDSWILMARQKGEQFCSDSRLINASASLEFFVYLTGLIACETLMAISTDIPAFILLNCIAKMSLFNTILFYYSIIYPLYMNKFDLLKTTCTWGWLT